MPELGFDWTHGELRYLRRGLGEAVVLVHDLHVGASHHEFEAIIPSLASGFEVFAVDLIGFGHSHAPRTTHTAEMHHHLLRDFIHEVVGGRAHAVVSGLSCGIVARLGVWDDPLLGDCVMISPRVDDTAHDWPHLSERIAQFMMGTLQLGGGFYESVSTRAALREFLESRYANPRAALRETTLDRLHQFGRLPASQYAYFSLVNRYFDVDLWQLVRYMRSRVKVLWGERLGPPPTGQLRQPAVWARGREIKIIPGTRHWPHDERPRQTADAILEFLNGR